MLNIGEQIKRLRKEQNVTQDKLAKYLNISYQAISKWENGTAYPDITMIPKIANFFDVTSDELLGMDKEENEDELKNYDVKFHDNIRQGKVFENITLCREVLEKYPRNFQWMVYLAQEMTHYCYNEEQLKYSIEHDFLNEVISLCERVVEDCTEDMLRHKAIRMLCTYYPKIGKKDEAVGLANKMPYITACREFLLADISTGEEKIKNEQQLLLDMIDLSAGTLFHMSKDAFGEFLSLEEKLKCAEASVSLYKTILHREEDSLFYNCRMCVHYCQIARIYCEMQNPDKAVESLLQAEKCASLYDKCCGEKAQNYKSPLVNRCIFDPGKMGKNYEGTEKQLLLRIISQSEFDVLGDLMEFSALRKRLAER